MLRNGVSFACIISAGAGARRAIRELCYDIVPHDDGWAIMLAPGRTMSFPTKREAFDAAVELARKLRFVGIAVNVRVQHASEAPAHAKAS